MPRLKGIVAMSVKLQTNEVNRLTLFATKPPWDDDDRTSYIIAVGECGYDIFIDESSFINQESLLRNHYLNDLPWSVVKHQLTLMRILQSGSDIQIIGNILNALDTTLSKRPVNLCCPNCWSLWCRYLF